MYITTAGIGSPIPGVNISPAPCGRAIKMLLSGPIGDHGITILLARGELDLEADLCSDTRSVLPLVEALAEAVGVGIALDARSDARRRRDSVERTGARLRPGHRDLPKTACRCATRCAAPANC